ncbi:MULTISPECIES: flippase [Winogradskyella]|uniref:Oligosaccharide flippase family protein n=1 Tax=Winogradskyella damuponensis TaxID=943939 RepID=A0ABP8D051_9FLAO
MKFNSITSKLLNSSLLGSSLKVLFIKILGVLLLFAVSLFLTNYFPPELVGQYDFVRTLLMIIGGLSVLGMDQSIIYYSGFFKSQNSMGSLRATYFKMLTLVLLASSILWVLNSLIPNDFINELFNKPKASLLFNKVILALSFYAITFLNIDMLRALNKTILSELFRNIFRHLPFLFLAVYLVYNSNEAYLIDAYLWSFASLALVSFIIIYRKFLKSKFEIKIDNLSYKTIFLKSYPMAISALSYFLMQSIDVLLLAKYSTFDNVAFYAIAVKLSTISTLALLSINIIAGPKIAEFYSSNSIEKLRRLLQNSNRLILVLTLPVLIVLSLFSEWILGLFGKEYIVAQSALLILLGGQCFNFLLGPLGVYMNMTGKQNKLQRILILGLLINVVLNIIYIPKYGMIGAASSTVVSMIIWKILATIIIYRQDKTKTFIS